MFCHKDLIDGAIPAADTDFDEDLSPIIKAWTSLYAATEEKHDAARFAADVPQDKQVSARGIEVGHIFFFGTKYSEPMGAKVQGPDGSMITLQMGSYGIGVSRLVGAIIEASHDKAGIVWPVPVAPFEVAVINLKAGDADTDKACADLYAKLQAAGIDVLYDDTDERAGAKFSTMELIGVPYQLVVGPKGVKAGEVEVKHPQGRRQGDAVAGCGAEARRGVGQGPAGAGVETDPLSPSTCGGEGQGEGRRLAPMSRLRPPLTPTLSPFAKGDGEREKEGDMTTTTTTSTDTRPFAAFEWMLAMRYLRARRKEGFISVIAGFSFVGILLGVATLIIVMAVMNGFRHQLFEKILGLNGHAVVYKDAARRPVRGIRRRWPRSSRRCPACVTPIPLIEGQVLYSSPVQALGGFVRGMTEDGIKAIPLVAKNIIAGTLDELRQPGGGVAVGSRLAQLARPAARRQRLA